MDHYSLLALGIIVLSLLILFLLSQVLRSLIRKQINEQMKTMIPKEGIRKRVGIRIKWRKK